MRANNMKIVFDLLPKLPIKVLSLNVDDTWPQKQYQKTLMHN